MSDRLLSTFPLPAPTLSALARAGYETSSDLSSLTPEQLSKDLNIPLPASQAVFSATRPTAAPPMTQSAAAMMGTTTQYSTACAPLDRLLGGGLKRGHILEINGPPGSGKEQIAANAVTSFVDANQEVLFVDMQNMVLPATIKRILMERPTADAGGMALVRYHTLHTTAELVVFLRTLPAYLAARPAVKQDYKDRNAILDLLRQVLMRACASMGLTVIITSQLVSKSCQRDGESGSAPLGSKYTMIPSFGAAQFPSGKTYRVILVPKTRTTGDMRLLSSPTHVPSAHALREEPYQRVRGAIA
ncbi:hypothetical protein VTO73DRAFT_10790 [Trametes versicolor]